MDANVLAAAAAGAVGGGVVTFTAMRWWHARGSTAASTLDPLTGVADRRGGERRLTGLRHGDAVVMVDIDYFKAVNETGGHAHGDAVLREFAAALAASVREDDLVVRWGGDEFVLILAGAGESALRITQRLHAAWAATRTQTAVTCSAGVAVHDSHDPSATLAAADAAMFAAKRSGRDCVAAG